jgi:hypothetical protein
VKQAGCLKQSFFAMIILNNYNLFPIFMRTKKDKIMKNAGIPGNNNSYCRKTGKRI